MIAVLLGMSTPVRPFGTELLTVYSLIYLAVPAILTTGAGLITSTVQGTDHSKEKVALYMRQNHANIVHDLVVGKGPILESWGSAFQLSVKEQERFETILDNSPEQMAMLKSLQGEITPEDAVVFSKGIYSLLEKTAGPERLQKIITAALRKSEKNSVR